MYFIVCSDGVPHSEEQPTDQSKAELQNQFSGELLSTLFKLLLQVHSEPVDHHEPVPATPHGAFSGQVLSDPAGGAELQSEEHKVGLVPVASSLVQTGAPVPRHAKVLQLVRFQPALN